IIAEGEIVLEERGLVDSIILVLEEAGDRLSRIIGEILGREVDILDLLRRQLLGLRVRLDAERLLEVDAEIDLLVLEEVDLVVGAEYRRPCAPLALHVDGGARAGERVAILRGSHLSRADVRLELRGGDTHILATLSDRQAFTHSRSTAVLPEPPCAR